MNKKICLIIPLLVFVLTGCHGAVDELYAGDEYITSNFLDNYYKEWNSIDSLQIVSSSKYNATALTHAQDPAYSTESETPLTGLRSYSDGTNIIGDQYLNGSLLKWNSDTPISDKGYGYGPTKNLSSISDSFSYGYLSKLYDGRVRCDGYYAKSRVQLNKTGYATYFPKELITYNYFAMAIRGGTDCERSFATFPTLDFEITFYKPVGDGTYNAIIINIDDLSVITNAGGRTYFVNFYFDSLFGSDWANTLNGVTAMSLTFSLKSSMYSDLTDDMNDGEKHHFALMLYEVLLPDSTWR